MKLELTQKFKSVVDKKVLKDGGKELTLGTVCCNALLVADPSDKKADSKVKKFNMAVKLADKDSVDVTAEEIVLLKSCINTAYEQPLIVGQALNLLDACGSELDPAVTDIDAYIPSNEE